MNALSIADTTIRQDAEGRFCLNDLYRASGGVAHHRPSKWQANKSAIGLVAAIDSEPEFGLSGTQLKARIRAYSTTQNSGAYVVKELVYAYAMWISPAFSLKVIRAYDALVTGEFIQPNTQCENYWFARRPHWQAIRARVLDGQPYRHIAAVLGRSAGSVVRAVRRMIAVGLLDPAKVVQVQRGPARAAAARLVAGWGLQLDLGWA